MIEAKYRYAGETNWKYKDFDSEDEMLRILDEDPRQIEEYDSRPKQINNPIKNWFGNLKNTKKNWKKVQGSPYASMVFGLKARQIIIGFLIPWLIYRFYKMIMDVRIDGMMGLINKLFMLGIGIFICWKIYQTIPIAKKNIEYYKKYPHTINHVPTNTKETVDDILNKIKSNKREVKKKDVTGKRKQKS